MNEKTDQDLINEFLAAAAEGDDAILALIRNLSYTGMSLALALVIHQLQSENFGSMEAVISLLKDHRDQWRHAAESEIA
jgi:hypothetical protein